MANGNNGNGNGNGNGKMPPWAGYVAALLMGGGVSGGVVGSLGGSGESPELKLCEYKVEVLEKDLNTCKDDLRTSELELCRWKPHDK